MNKAQKLILVKSQIHVLMVLNVPKDHNFSLNPYETEKDSSNFIVIDQYQNL